MRRIATVAVAKIVANLPIIGSATDVLTKTGLYVRFDSANGTIQDILSAEDAPIIEHGRHLVRVGLPGVRRGGVRS